MEHGPCAGRDRLDLRQGPAAAAARHADVRSWSTSTPSAAGLEWQPDVKEELRVNSSGQSQGDATLYPPHQGQPAAGDRRRTGRARPPYRRDHPADARGARGGHQPVRRSHVDPGSVQSGALSHGAAVLVPVADNRTADPAPGGRRRAKCARATAARAACRRFAGAARRGRRAGHRAVGIPRARCGHAWTRSSSSPPTWRTRSRIRYPRSAAPSRPCAASRTLPSRSACWRSSREDVTRLDRLISDISGASRARCRAVAHGRRAGGRGADTARHCGNGRGHARSARSPRGGGRAIIWLAVGRSRIGWCRCCAIWSQRAVIQPAGRPR